MIGVIGAFYLMIPAYVANMLPPFVRKLPFNAPMDFGLTFGGKRIFGDHKTLAGFIFGVLGSVLAGVIMSSLYWPFDFSPILWSCFVGAGALLGDALKSFFKRRAGISPGKSWIPFDQVDYSVGALFFGSFVFFVGWLNSAAIIIISAFGHVAVNHIGFYLGVRDSKW